MHSLIEVPLIGAALFHSRSGGFPLAFCSYALLDENSNHTADLENVAVVRVTALNGERFRLRDRDEMHRFLAAVGRLADEVIS